MIHSATSETSKENPSSSFTPLFDTTASETKKSNWRDIISSQEPYQLIANIKQKGMTTALSPKRLTQLQHKLEQSGNILLSTKRRLYPYIIDKTDNIYAIHDRIDKGSTSQVRMAQNLKTLEWYAVKIVNDNEERALLESNILQKLSLLKGNQERVTAKGVHKSYLFLPLANGLKLKDFLHLVKKHKKTFSATEQAQLLHSMLLAMQSLIQANINHGDIHDQNIIFDPLTQKTHLVDFGEATEVNTQGNHHQHYDIRKLFSLLKPVISEHSLHVIAHQHLITWDNLKPNLQAASDKVAEMAAPLKENRVSLRL